MKYFKLGYGINFKYKGMIAHCFNRVYVVKKFILPNIKDLNFSTINFDETCNFVREKNGYSVKARKYISDLVVYCRKMVPFVHYYRKKISSFNCTAHNILANKSLLILLKFPKIRKVRYRK